ncbi:hypothetical protein ACLF6K_11535 [Streptomyces xanthophaeus]|uniref:hypothetical protein n=1 Tax=Streptomyces xanthophaeus TaxID=67385 RepID=UPI00398FC355
MPRPVASSAARWAVGPAFEVFEVAGGAVGHRVVGVAEVGAAGEFRQAHHLGAFGGGQGHALAQAFVVLGRVGVPAHLDEADAQEAALGGLRAGRGAERGAVGGEEFVAHAVRPLLLGS